MSRAQLLLQSPQLPQLLVSEGEGAALEAETGVEAGLAVDAGGSEGEITLDKEAEDVRAVDEAEGVEVALLEAALLLLPETIEAIGGPGKT